MDLADLKTRALVDPERDLVSREIFVDPTLYAAELERIFATQWLFVGHVSQVRRPGDFVVSRMGEESVLLVRDVDGELHVFLNSCRHRGMQVCRYDQGNASEFACPYHGWTYDTKGRLGAVPALREGYFSELELAEWGLVEARVAELKGSIWACWDAATPGLEDWLGDARIWIEEFFTVPDVGVGELELIAGVQKWTLPCNWKFGAENFSGDNYHNVSHASVDQLALSPSGKAGRHQYDAIPQKPVLQNIAYAATGHSGRGALYPPGFDFLSAYAAVPELHAYYRRAYAAREQQLGERARMVPHGGTIFPNMSFSNGRTSIALWHPAGPETCEVWRFYFVPEYAPAAVKDHLRRYVIRYQGPSGLTEEDDMENWNLAHRASRGTIARRHPYHMAMGLGHEMAAGSEPWIARGGTVMEGVSEQNQRGYYRRWAQLMGVL